MRWLVLTVAVLALCSLSGVAAGTAPTEAIAARNGTIPTPIFVWATAGTTNTTMCSAAAALVLGAASSQELCGWSKECACESLLAAASQASVLLGSPPSPEVDLFRGNVGGWMPPLEAPQGAVVVAQAGTYGKDSDVDIVVLNQPISFMCVASASRRLYLSSPANPFRSESGSGKTHVPLRYGSGFLFLETEFEHVLSGFTFGGVGDYLVELFYCTKALLLAGQCGCADE